MRSWAPAYDRFSTHIIMDNETNPREELYLRFKESLRHPVNDRFFDEDELVDIYDYAGDMDDDYVQLEVLLCGARLYPESEILAERKALLYLDTTDEETNERTKAAGQFLADNPEASSMIFDIARLQVAPPENAQDALEFLCNQYQRFDDEEVIRFIQLALDLDCYDWLITHLEELKQKVDFLPTLYYEIAREADDRNDNRNLIKLADALIEVEPFVSQYWMMLLRGQARLNEKEAATQTFDYAMALAGDNAEAMLALTEICYNHADYLLPQMVDSLTRLKQENPDDFRYWDCYCAVNSKLQRTDKVLNALRDFGTRHPENPIVVRHLLTYGSDDAIDYMTRFFENNPDGIQALNPNDIIPELMSRGNKRELISYLEWMKVLSPHDYGARLPLLLDFYYICCLFEKVVELAVLYKDDFDYLLTESPAAAYIYCHSLIKLRQYGRALKFSREKRSHYENLIKSSFVSNRMALASLLSLFDKIDLHNAEDTLFWDCFDALNIGKF